MARVLLYLLLSFAALAESKKFWGFLDGMATEVEKDSDLTTVTDLVNKGTGITVKSCGKKHDVMKVESAVFDRATLQVRIVGNLSRKVSGGLIRVKMHKGKDSKDASTGDWMKRTLAWSSVPHMYEEDLCKHVRKNHSRRRCPIQAGRHEFRLALDKLPPMVVAGAYKLRIAALDSSGEPVACALAKLEVPRGAKGELFRRVQALPSAAGGRAGGRHLQDGDGRCDKCVDIPDDNGVLCYVNHEFRLEHPACTEGSAPAWSQQCTSMDYGYACYEMWSTSCEDCAAAGRKCFRGNSVGLDWLDCRVAGHGDLRGLCPVPCDRYDRCKVGDCDEECHGCLVGDQFTHEGITTTPHTGPACMACADTKCLQTGGGEPMSCNGTMQVAAITSQCTGEYDWWAQFSYACFEMESDDCGTCEMYKKKCFKHFSEDPGCKDAYYVDMKGMCEVRCDDPTCTGCLMGDQYYHNGTDPSDPGDGDPSDPGDGDTSDPGDGDPSDPGDGDESSDAAVFASPCRPAILALLWPMTLVQ